MVGNTHLDPLDCYACLLKVQRYENTIKYQNIPLAGLIIRHHQFGRNLRSSQLPGVA